MIKLKDILYNILYIIYFCIMAYSFTKGNTDLLILSSIFYISTVMNEMYEELMQKIKD